MITSANQLYKASKSKLPFKEWLLEEQQNGALADHEKMFNANGEEIDDIVDEEDVIVKRKPTTKKAQSSIMRNNIIGIVAMGLIIYGLNKYSSQASE
tara:strand:- start:195 stop:485 length:291 start_codon:yes stop_codon:yes gene_type:complete